MTCPHGEVHPSACIECIEAPAPARSNRRPPRRMGATGDGTHRMTARFDSRCPGCGQGIEADVDEITLVEGEWLCSNCA